MTPQPIQSDDRDFWQEWGVAKKNIEDIHGAIFSDSGIVKRVERLEQIMGRIVAFCVLLSIASTASYLHFFGDKAPLLSHPLLSGVVAVAGVVGAVITGGWDKLFSGKV